MSEFLAFSVFRIMLPCYAVLSMLYCLYFMCDIAPILYGSALLGALFHCINKELEKKCIESRLFCFQWHSLHQCGQLQGVPVPENMLHFSCIELYWNIIKLIKNALEWPGTHQKHTKPQESKKKHWNCIKNILECIKEQC